VKILILAFLLALPAFAQTKDGGSSDSGTKVQDSGIQNASISAGSVQIRTFTLTFFEDGGVQAYGCGRALISQADGGSYLLDLPSCVSYALTPSQLQSGSVVWGTCLSLLVVANGL
jgi:hypothetical protein